MNKDVADKTARLDRVAESFNGKDVEAAQLSVEISELQKNTAALSSEKQKLYDTIEVLNAAKSAGDLEI